MTGHPQPPHDPRDESARPDRAAPPPLFHPVPVETSPAPGEPSLDAAPAAPWEAEPPAEAAFDADGRRIRHDAFTEARKCVFLKALVKTGGILDACRAAGVSARTIYRHQEEDPCFLENCRAALGMSATPVELVAWRRAVEGVEQEFACGGQVHVRRRYDSGLLRLLLQGSNPKKYGARPGFGRKRLLRHERKAMEREIRAEIAAEEPSGDDVLEALVQRMAQVREAEAEAKHAAGWTKSPAGDWVPPGYAPVPGWTPPPPEAPAGEPPAAAMRQS